MFDKFELNNFSKSIIFQIEALSFPYCQSLTKDYVKLWKSGEKSTKPYEREWTEFFRAAVKDFFVEIDTLAVAFYTNAFQKDKERDVAEARGALKKLVQIIDIS